MAAVCSAMLRVLILTRCTLFVSRMVAMPTVHEQVHEGAQEHKPIGQPPDQVSAVRGHEVVASNAKESQEHQARA
jgi:hypothetical protein